LALSRTRPTLVQAAEAVTGAWKYGAMACSKTEAALFLSVTCA
jgi:hypothetical protein